MKKVELLINEVTELLKANGIDLTDIKYLDLDHQDYLINNIIVHDDPKVTDAVRDYYKGYL